MYPHTLALARHLAKPIVAFDLKHTRGTNATRSITDFGAVRITPDSDVQHYSSWSSRTPVPCSTRMYRDSRASIRRP